MLSNYGLTETAKILTGQATMPASLWLALCTATPVPSDTGSTISEFAALNGYARTQIFMDNLNWSAPALGEGVSYYGTPLTLQAFGGSWGTAIGYALCTASTLGEVFHYGDLAYPVTFTDGKSVELIVNSLSIRVA